MVTVGFTDKHRTRRADVGALARWVIPDTGNVFGIRALHSAVVTARGSAVQQRHAHQFGTVREDINTPPGLVKCLCLCHAE